MNIFEIASRRKLRFQYKGNLSVEDLWTLPLPELDTLYASLANESKPSLLTKQDSTDVRIEIVKHIFTTRQTEAEAAQQAVVDKQRREKLDRMIEEKSFENLSLEELKEMRSKL